MNPTQLKTRDIKGYLTEIIKSEHWKERIDELHQLPARKAVNPLISFFCSTDEKLKWRSITALGQIISRLADADIESARVIMRRLMWMLNDESGGIGWGAPEAIGEITACHEQLAQEFASILVSYSREDGNFLELENLQRGLIWGLGRLAQVRPEMLEDLPQLLPFYLNSPDSTVRGIAAWAAGILRAKELKSHLEKLLKDQSKIKLYHNYELQSFSVSELAERSLQMI